jgi:hypothetical protein
MTIVVTDIQVDEIRKAWIAGSSQASLARLYNLSDSQVGRIVYGKRRGKFQHPEPTIPDGCLPIPEWPGYCISECGELYSCRTNGKDRPWHWRRRIPYLNRDGYLEMHLQAKEKEKIVRVHTLVLIAFVGPCPPGFQACHNNGNRLDNRVSNLRWDTQQSNIDDRGQHGNSPRGERHGNSKLTAEQVVEMRKLRSEGLPLAEIAKRFSVHSAHAGKVISGVCWGHVDGFTASQNVRINRREVAEEIRREQGKS